MSDIYKSAGILIQNRQLLVEKSFNKKFYIAPGGSIEPGETVKQALVRELKEEFDVDTSEEDFEFFGDFKAPAAGQEQRIVHMKVYLVKSWQGEPTSNSEVEIVEWITSDNPKNLLLGSIFEHEVIPKLLEMDLMD